MVSQRWLKRLENLVKLEHRDKDEVDDKQNLHHKNRVAEDHENFGSMLVFVPILEVANLKHDLLESDHHDVEPKSYVVCLLLVDGFLDS